MPYGNGRSDISCADFDLRLSDVLDGKLAGKELEEFRAHVEACLDCGPVYEHARQGLAMLNSLDEVEPPLNLVQSILAKTSMRPATAAAVEGKAGWGRKLADFISPSLAPAFAAFSVRSMMQPRFAMTTAMAFFSLTVVMNVAGVSFNDIRKLDLRPNAIATSASLQFHETKASVIKYYENIRFLNEWEARLKAVQDSSASDEQKHEQQQQNPADDNTSERERRQQEKDVNYSLQQAASFLAVNFINIPVSTPAGSERR